MLNIKKIPTPLETRGKQKKKADGRLTSDIGHGHLFGPGSRRDHTGGAESPQQTGAAWAQRQAAHG